MAEHVRFQVGLTESFVANIRSVCQIPVRDLFICVWSYRGEFDHVDLVHDVYVVVTTHHVCKAQAGMLQCCRRDQISRVNLWRSGLFKWDQIMIECGNGTLVHQFGVWHRSASEYLTDILSRPSPFLAFDGRDPLEQSSSWGCARCTLLNLRANTYCRACLNQRPANIPKVLVSTNLILFSVGYL